jgi:uncharacterized membrane protein
MMPEARKMIGVGFVFLWFFVGGIAHFAATDFEMKIVPPSIPWPRAAVLGTGICELVGASGLLDRRTRSTAATGLFLLTIAVTPANIYMLQHPAMFRIAYWLLVLRLPLQAALLALIGWIVVQSRRTATRPERGRTGI